MDSFRKETVDNPATGEAWRFIHVSVGASGGKGTFEQPFGEVTTALGVTQSDGNRIVYVNTAQSAELSGFSIAESVRVLSSGPQQFLPATRSPAGSPASSCLVLAMAVHPGFLEV